MKLVGLLLILLIIYFSGGESAAWSFVEALGAGIFDIIKSLPGLLKAFDPLIGFSDWIKEKLFFIIIIMLLSWTGVFLSGKHKRMLWTIICFLGGIISSALLMCSLGEKL